MTLATITAISLPDQVYAHAADHDVALTAGRETFRPVTGDGWVKPAIGTGLWTAPVTTRHDDGSPADSAWLERMREDMEADTSDLLLTEIHPSTDAQILLIDCQEHLAAIVDAFPAAPHVPGLRRIYPGWQALAEAGWDAVYLTDRGQWATRLPVSGPDLYGWDLECVLWLRHAYTVGRTTPSAAHAATERSAA
ncbi:hypothetical protein [Streptomyces youssoufiensis]